MGVREGGREGLREGLTGVGQGREGVVWRKKKNEGMWKKIIICREK